ncbi:protein of unknown function [Shewanella benthica]|uniref:Uncharacterized protein n=1 Tax=Shewanella benthica TaxID=43661 RepID=A0A330LYQ4_9GAMM|nr:protein of unknown function [Shewanella benthica]
MSQDSEPWFCNLVSSISLASYMNAGENSITFCACLLSMDSPT